MNSSIFQKKKVVRIEENGRCHLIDWTPGDKIDGINTDHENLMGLEHKGLKLGMFGLEWSDSCDPPYGGDMMARWDEEARTKKRSYGVNKLANKILDKVRHGERIPNYRYPGTIKGPVLLYDDESDMTRDKWNLIREFMKK